MDDAKTEAIVKEKVRRVSDAMSQEGMPLDDEIIGVISECLRGHMSFEDARLFFIDKKNNKGGLGGK